MRISGVDGVISIELMIDWTNVNFGLMFIKTNFQNLRIILQARGTGSDSKSLYLLWVSPLLLINKECASHFRRATANELIKIKETKSFLFNSYLIRKSLKGTVVNRAFPSLHLCHCKLNRRRRSNFCNIFLLINSSSISGFIIDNM